MNKDTTPQEFWDRADEIITVVNAQIEKSTVSKVSSSLLYAAARFNTFNIASHAGTAQEMRNDKIEAIKYFTEQYRQMLEENIDDYIENFESYATNE